MDYHRQWFATALEHRRGPPLVAVRRDGNLVTIEVREAPLLGHPVRHLQCRVPQRAGQDLFQLTRLASCSKSDDKIANAATLPTVSHSRVHVPDRN